MANGNGTIIGSWKLAFPIGALGLLGALLLTVQKDAAIALDVAKQHGQELLLLHGELQILHEHIRNRTQLRYTSRDAERDFRYIQKDLDACMEAIKEHKKNGH